MKALTRNRPLVCSHWVLWACWLLLAPACVRDTRKLEAARAAPAAYRSGLVTHSWGLCSLIGPRNVAPGIYGTDLGFTARPAHADKLTMLFGDTWIRPVDGCQYMPTTSDDFQARLPATRPAQFSAGAPSNTAAVRCDLLEYTQERPGDPTSWPRIRLFPDLATHRDDAVLDMSALRTPAAAFSDGEHMFAVFFRNDPVYCDYDTQCPKDMHCSNAADGPKLGQCSSVAKLAPDAAPELCRGDKDCGAGGTCKEAERAVCLADRPFRLHMGDKTVVPTWYRDDPRRAIARTMYIALAAWPERPSDYGIVARFPTNRFQNIAVRGVRFFDALHPERNDYRPGYHTLLMWGRAAFAEYGGAQALPFLAYVPLGELRTEPEAMRFQPRFFAGFDAKERPTWSRDEGDAQPVYGTDASLLPAPTRDGASNEEAIVWREPEFDYVEWASVSYVAPLRRWVMLYSGDLPAFIVFDPATGRAREQVHLQVSPGAIHMRSAKHPWGAPRGADPGAWTSAEPILTRHRLAHYLACGGDKTRLPGCVEDAQLNSPLELLGALADSAATDTPAHFTDVAGKCIVGALAYQVQNAASGDLIGRMYAPNIIDEWTTDLTPPGRATTGPHSAEIFWNVSTWNPYQVVLVKSRIDER